MRQTVSGRRFVAKERVREMIQRMQRSTAGSQHCRLKETADSDQFLSTSSRQPQTGSAPHVRTDRNLTRGPTETPLADQQTDRHGPPFGQTGTSPTLTHRPTDWDLTCGSSSSSFTISVLSRTPCRPSWRHEVSYCSRIIFEFLW